MSAIFALASSRMVIMMSPRDWHITKYLMEREAKAALIFLLCAVPVVAIVRAVLGKTLMLCAAIALGIVWVLQKELGSAILLGISVILVETALPWLRRELSDEPRLKKLRDTFRDENDPPQ